MDPWPCACTAPSSPASANADDDGNAASPCALRLLTLLLFLLPTVSTAVVLPPVAGLLSSFGCSDAAATIIAKQCCSAEATSARRE